MGLFLNAIIAYGIGSLFDSFLIGLLLWVILLIFGGTSGEVVVHSKTNSAPLFLFGLFIGLNMGGSE